MVSRTHGPAGHSDRNVAGPPPLKGMVWVPGGAFLMGSDRHYPEEAPSHEARVAGFWMDASPVTNLQFTRFVKATGYMTMAERPPRAEDYPGADPALLVPGSLVFQKPSRPVDLAHYQNWWAWVPGAHWRQPEGPGSTLNGRERHPVVHVAWDDALAYAAWMGASIPGEAEWEFAARGGLVGAEYAWGDELYPGGRALANTWQGEFPHQNSLADGYERTSPVGSFPANPYGLYDMIGNVWEWTSDWYASSHALSSCCGPAGTTVGTAEASYDPLLPGVRIPRRVTKGGSFLCAPSYCRRYRPAARMAQGVDTSTCHLGFRCIVRV